MPLAHVAAGPAASELVEQATGRGGSRSFSSSTPAASPRVGGGGGSSRRGSVPGGHYSFGEPGTGSDAASALLPAPDSPSRWRGPRGPSAAEDPISAASLAALGLSGGADAGRAAAAATLAANAAAEEVRLSV